MAGGVDRCDAAARLQHARVRLAAAPRLRQRRRLQGAADRLLRHHLSASLDDSRAAVRQLSRSAADLAADGRRAARAVRCSRAADVAARRLVAGGHRRLLPAAQRLVFLLGGRLGVRAAADDAGAAVSRARPRAALGTGASRPDAGCCSPAGSGAPRSRWWPCRRRRSRRRRSRRRCASCCGRRFATAICR